ncbi:LamG-like jellyroll fold domain-containing protein [Actinoplanes subtropicus]|uniref:LamG-like jellyroll fold domain-containing protein n=1 Tax=Actinoplanes subtropicus TaxID=543632 RepID=UPI0004C3BD4D|nr:LamG-like jellyroll fold domain-containing protein [Actinoplanes subtropicus]
MRRAILCMVALALVGATGPSAHAAVTPDYSVHYTFDGPTLLADVSGHGHDLTPVSRHGGSYLTVPHDGGSALVFPPPCHLEPCPKIALRAVPADDLNPGSRPIRFGASVRLDPDETTKGENVLQKGYSASGSQWKLQIDGAEGKPSCVFVDDRRRAIHLALSSVSVADGKWHALECRRAGSQVTVLVDGVRRGGMTIPADLSVDNRIPLSVGGKGSFSNNDQFQGALDDVWVTIGQ